MIHASTCTIRPESLTNFNFSFVFMDHEMFCVLSCPGRAIPGLGPPAVASFLHRLRTKTLVIKMHQEQKRLRRVTSGFVYNIC